MLYPPYAPADVASIRRQMIEYLDDPVAVETQAFMIEIGKQGLAPLLIPSIDRQAHMLIADERRRFAEAELYFVTDEMMDVAAAASASAPDLIPVASDFPSRFGLMVFAKPLARRPMELEEYSRAFAVLGEDGARYLAAREGEARIVAATWGPFGGGRPWGSYHGGGNRGRGSLCGDWDGDGVSDGGIWINFYTAVTEATRAAQQGIRDQGNTPVSDLFPLNAENECAFALAPAVIPEGLDPKRWILPHDFIDGAPTSETTAGWSRALLVVFALMRERLAEVRAAPVPRPERRRAIRAGIGEPPAVRLVQVRRPALREDDAPATAAAREWHHSWIVGGHWRNQWYPSANTHRPKYIAPYVKGPEDKPLLGTEKVRVFDK